MKLSVLPSLALLAALASTSTTVAQNNTNPRDPTRKTPGIFGQARSAFTDQKMYLGEAKFTFENETQILRTIFWSLDFSQPWRTDAPAWTKLVYQPGLTNDTARPMAINKNGTAVYCFDTSQAIKYNTSQAAWQKPFNLTLPFNTLGDAIADTDQDTFFHLNQNLTAAVDSLQLVLFNPQNNGGQVVSSDMGRLVNTTTLTPGTAFPKGVYSSSSKSLYFANTVGPNVTQYQFNVAKQAWANLTEKGDIPQSRSGQCYVSAAGGTKIIMAGGLRPSNSTTPPENSTALPTPTTSPTSTTSPSPTASPGSTPPTNYNDVLSDVHVFDVASSTWTKVATGPVGFYGSICAVNGDYLILYGGYNQYSSVPLRMVYNANTPYILNLKNNTWATNFEPAKVGGPAPSGASGKKTIGFAGVVVSVLAAGLALL